MSGRPKLLDLFCCEGGAAMGYSKAGFAVVGVDINPQPRYPFEFHQGNALDVLRRLIDGESLLFDGFWDDDEDNVDSSLALDDFDAIHASPPCQAHTNAWKIQKNDHPDLIAPTRRLLVESRLPYIIENVPGAPLHDPVMLCGAMFALRTYRHRLFESNVTITVREHPVHVARNAKMGRLVQDDEYMQVVGNFTGAALGRIVMEMPWASRDGLREAIPPAYTEFIGAQLLASLSGEVTA